MKISLQKIRKSLDIFLKVDYNSSVFLYKDCPICGNPLDKKHRNKMLNDLAKELYKKL